MSKYNEFHRNFAVIIGINEYQNGIRELKTAVPDALKLAEIIQKQHEALKPQYQQQNKYEVLLFLNQRANLSQLKQLIADFQQGEISLDNEKVTVTKDDRILFYFAGHGIALDALENQEGPVGYLIPQDATSGDSSTYLPMQELHDALNALSCRHMLAILDCCFAGAFRWASLKREIVPKFKVYKERYDRFISDAAWQVITSAADDQKALDSLGTRGIVTDGNEEHSPFAKALFDALLGKGADFNQDGIITATNICSYLRDQVETQTEKHYQRQTPSLCPLRKHDKGEFIFLSPNFDRDKLEDAPPLNVESNPYRGLSSYDEKDSKLFFGREEQIQKLYQKVVENKQQLTLVLGASGTGKSSLVKAGLIPKLRKNYKTWRILPPFRPGESPLKSLNNVLESIKQPLIQAATSSRLFTPAEESLGNWFKNNPKVKLLVVIDQFEELITLSKSEEAEKFQLFIKNSLAKYPNNIHVVITLRLDFEAQFQTSVLKDLWNDDARFVVPPMSQNEFREAIEKPASQKVVYFDPPTLVDELINEVVQMPGALPLLSFTLSELYLKYLGDRTRDNRALTKKDYEDLGRVVGSITQRANQEYEKLVAENLAYQDTVRRVMLRMVSLQGGELARRQVHRSELVYPCQEESDRVQTVIKRFSEARLIVEGSNSEGKPYVEPAHDALVCGWDKLLAWRREDEDKIILQRRLTPDAEEWGNRNVAKKLQPSGLQTTTENVIDWLDRKLYVVENSFNKTTAQFVQQLRRTENQPEGSREKQVQFLWDGNPYLDVLNQELQSNNNWLNQVEAEFVQQSVLQKRQNISWRWRIAIAVILGLSGLSGLAGISWGNAEISQINTFAQSSDGFLGLDGRKAVESSVKAAVKMRGQLWGVDANTRTQVKLALLKTVHNVVAPNTLGRHAGEVRGITFSRNGKMLASGSADNTVKLWNPSTGEEIKTLTGHTDKVNGVSFSPDGKILASASDDKTVKLWNISTGEEIKTLTGHTHWVKSITFSPDGKMLASASADNTVKLWDTSTLKEIKTLSGHTDSVNDVRFSPDGKMLASASGDKTVKLWDISTRTLIKTLTGHQKWVSRVRFSPDGKMLASAGLDDKVKLWNPITGTLIKTLTGEWDVMGISFSPDGKILASASDNKKVQLWDTITGKEIRRLTGHTGLVWDVSFSPDGKLATASGDEDMTVKLWDTSTGKEINSPLTGHTKEVRDVSFSRDGKMLASASADNTVKLWNTTTGILMRNLTGHTGSVNGVSFSRDGKILATASADTTVKLWDTSTYDEIKTLTGHTGSVNGVRFSRDGKMLASASDDTTVKLWDTSTYDEIKTLTGHTKEVRDVSFSPNGKMLASSSYDKTVKLWNTSTHEEIKTLNGHTSWVWGISFSPDGKMLASASGDTTVKLWNTTTGILMRNLAGHTSTVLDVSFSHDGKMLASASVDKRVKLWDTSTGTLIKTLTGHINSVNRISFSQDGKMLASASADNTVRLWRLDFDYLLEKGCNFMREYYKTNPPDNKSDKHLCDGVGNL
jgi:WD40 repeat protein/energy-coupling factor transporter ATP-binding protein EcfA2